VCNDGDDSANQEDHKKFIESFRTNKHEEIPDEDIWAQNDFLARLSGDSEVVKHLKSIFDSTTPEKLLQLRQATVRNDRLVCDNLSHELKGVAQNMQMPRLLQAIIMYREELLEKEKSSDILLQYFDLINEEFERARTVRL
jgi:HPt (histidine-containing phosphotransfer) domain-containing protein